MAQETEHFPDDLESMNEDYLGFCENCGEYQECVEPDAESYECEGCGQETVHGILHWILRKPPKHQKEQTHEG